MNKEKPTYYAIIPANVRYDKQLTPAVKLFYGEVTVLTQTTGQCWAGNKYFADLYGVSKGTISRWVRQLVECGYISVAITRKENSNEVEARIITLCSEMLVPPCQNRYDPPIKKRIENNTRENNTRENNGVLVAEDFLKRFNQITGRKFRVLDSKTKRQLKARLKDGFSIEEIFVAVKNCAADDYHQKNTQYLTPEFITRADKLQKYLNAKGKPTAKKRRVFTA